MARRLHAVLFDLDGTLVDTAPDLRGAANRLLRRHGRRGLSLDQIKAMIGDGSQTFVERAFAATGAPAGDRLNDLTAAFLADYAGHETELSRPYPGVAEALERLAGRRLGLAVCTNKPEAPSRVVLEHFGLARFFAAIVGGDSIAGVRKPDPRHPLAALAALGAGPAEAAFVGDHENDAAAAHAAAIPLIAVSFGYARVPLGELGAAAVIDAWAELPAALAALP